MNFHPDLGNIPSWIGAGSLLLAFRIFLRDRSRLDRIQVDAVGIWGDIQRNSISPGGPRIDDIKVRVNIRNATELPVEVHLVAFTFQTRWIVPYPESLPDPTVLVWQGVPGKADVMRFIGPTGIAPQKTWESQWVTINLTHTAPADNATLAPFSDGLKCVIAYALVVDNAGRRWEARQRQGKSAKRIRWYSRSREHYPLEWRNPIGRSFRSFRSRAQERTRRIGRNPTSGELPNT
jgi:hypothetical protein